MSLPENACKSFVVPSLLQEGGKGDDPELKGVDLKISDDYFIQFKMVDWLKSSGAKEIYSKRLKKSFTPYFRFPVKNSDASNQFNSLVNLATTFTPEGKKKRVFYISPLLSLRRQTPEQAFNCFWAKKPQQALEDHTVWIDFHQFKTSNPLEKETNDKHVVCYNHDSIRSNLGFLFSEQKEIEASSFKIAFVEPEEAQAGMGRAIPPQDKRKYINRMNFIANTVEGDARKVGRNYTLAQLIQENQQMRPLSLVRTVQNELMVRHNILWLPVLNTKTQS